MLWTGSYMNRSEEANPNWFGGFDTVEATRPVLIDNTVAGRLTFMNS